jgi:hypothetical protein
MILAKAGSTFVSKRMISHSSEIITKEWGVDNTDESAVIESRNRCGLPLTLFSPEGLSVAKKTIEKFLGRAPASLARAEGATRLPLAWIVCAAVGRCT